MLAESSKTSDKEQEGASSEHTAFLQRIDERFTQERSERELALVAQEHRLIPAVSNLITALLAKDQERRRQLLPKAASAVFWCLIPSSGTAGVGIVALLSLFVAWQQVQLLNAQNQKIEVQNILAEAQRRSGLMFETSAIFQQIEDEKRAVAKATKKVICNGKIAEQCWTAGTTRSLFVPSNATVGRIAALTQALRPYRYLSVEDQGPYRFRGDENSNEICPEAINTELLDYAATIAHGASVGADGKPDPSPTDIGAIRASMRKRATELGIASSFDGWTKRLGGSLARALAGISNVTLTANEVGNSAISCRASSPERGQLLVALHAASVDISDVASKGADFRYADLPGAQLKGITLRSIDLSNSRLPGASFDGAILENVNFLGAHLAGAKFNRAKLDHVNFSGAIIQAGGAQATNASLLFSQMRDSSFAGIRLVELGGQHSFFERWCVARRLANSLAAEVPHSSGSGVSESNPISLDGFALLTETRKYSDGSPDVMLGIVVPSGLKKTELFFSELSAGIGVEISYEPFSACEGNKPRAAQPGSPPDAPQAPRR